MKKYIIAAATVVAIVIIAGLVFPFGQKATFSQVINETDAKIILEAQNECEVGELVELDASKSNANSFAWRIVPGTKNFRVIEDGKMALFCSGQPGKYLFILAAAKADTIDCVVHTITVKPASPPPVPPDPFISKVRSWLPTNPDIVIIEKLARSFERVASAGHTDVAVLVKTTALSNRGILGTDLESYKSFLIAFSNYLKANYQDKSIEDHLELWFRMAAALRGQA